MIELQQVGKRYRNYWALQDVSVTIPTNQIVGIVGANGSGKSTLLKLIAGLARPSAGTVRVNGKAVNRRSSAHIAYLSELETYYPFFTVQEMVDFYDAQFADFDTKRAADLVQFMQLDKNKKVRNLSKGNRGRLKLVLTLARDVPFVLLDEPLSGLDPMVRESIIHGLLSYIDLEKQTVLITTHEIAEVEPLLDTVMLIREGEMVAMESVEQIRLEKQISVRDWMKELYAR